MTIKSKFCVGCLAAVSMILLGACASSDKNHIGDRYEPTSKAETIFQVSQVPKSCRVFAHLFATMPAAMTTQEFGSRVEEEAKAKGADLILIGQARQSTSTSSIDFAYYGPASEYSIQEWSGWRFALDEWSAQGSWTTLGYSEWMHGNVHFDYPAVVQAAFLRCQQ